MNITEFISALWDRVKGYVDEYVSEYDLLAVATTREKGQVKPDGTTITVDDDGTIHGVVSPDAISAAIMSLAGTSGGVAELDENGMIPSSQLPSYVDDVLEFANSAEFPPEGESGKIYIDASSSTTYRWSGSVYVEISSSIALGETISTAYRGDRGKIAFEHASSRGSEFPKGLYRFETNAEGHVTSAVAVQKSDITSLGIPGEVPTKVSDLSNDEGYITSVAIDGSTIKRNADGELYAVVESASFDESDPTVPSWAKRPTKPTYTASEVGALPDDTVIPTKVSDLENDEGYITSVAIDGSTIKRNADGELYAVVESASFDESDPTVPDWAKQQTKPTYTASEVGALPDDTVIPTKVSDLSNDEGYITEESIDNATIKRNADGELYAVVESASFDESDPTVPSWAKRPTKPTYTASEVGALPDDTVIPTKVSDLNDDMGIVTFEDLHGHLISDFTNDAGYATVDMVPDDVSQLSNSVGYMTYEDLPNNVSVFTNDAGYLTDESDPTVPAWAKASTKPTYTASEVGAISTSKIGTANGVAELDASGKVPSSQLPSYVDDVLSYWTTAYFPDTGEAGKIYVSENDNTTYRWSGSRYVMISQSISLGETASTAYRGDRGKVAYEHALTKGSQNSQGMYKFATNSQGHVISAEAIRKSDITALGIPGSVPTKVSELDDDLNLSTIDDIRLPDGMTIGNVDGTLSVIKSTEISETDGADYTYLLYKSNGTDRIMKSGSATLIAQNGNTLVCNNGFYGYLEDRLEFYIFKDGKVYYSNANTVTVNGSKATFSYPKNMRYLGRVDSPNNLGDVSLAWDTWTLQLSISYRIKVTHEIGFPEQEQQEITVATNESTGIVKPDNETIIVSDDGTLSIAKRESTLVQVGRVAVNKGDFSYIMLRTDGNGRIYYITSLYVELLIDNFRYMADYNVPWSNDGVYISNIAVVINADGNIYVTKHAVIEGQWLNVKQPLINVGKLDALANANDLSSVRVSNAYFSRYLTTYEYYYLTNISFFKDEHVAGLPIDNDTIKINNHGLLQANITTEKPLYFSNNKLGLNYGNGITTEYLGDYYLAVSMDYIYDRFNTDSSGLFIYNEDNNRTGIRIATSTSAGIVQPDNKTIFIKNGVLSVNSYEDVINSLQNTVNDLTRRVTALEKKLGLDTMTYDDGTLYVNSTYEDGTLVTGRTYEDGTLL